MQEHYSRNEIEEHGYFTKYALGKLPIYNFLFPIKYMICKLL